MSYAVNDPSPCWRFALFFRHPSLSLLLLFGSLLACGEEPCPEVTCQTEVQIIFSAPILSYHGELIVDGRSRVFGCHARAFDTSAEQVMLGHCDEDGFSIPLDAKEFTLVFYDLEFEKEVLLRQDLKVSYSDRSAGGASCPVTCQHAEFTLPEF